MEEIDIHDAAGAELVAGAELLARALAFSDRDAIAPWLMQTGVACGGVALCATRAERVVGFSFALRCGRDLLFSCGLAVDRGVRGKGVGRRLKLAQRERARGLGVSSIRWTADPLSAGALALYLAVLGARLQAYEPELYAAVRPAPVPPDDVVIDWPVQSNGFDVPEQVRRVEIPFDHRALDAAELRRWRLAVREGMMRALDAGDVGFGVATDRVARRSWVLFGGPS
jgi:predicted GNAT superfamily acetyltransferase